MQARLEQMAGKLTSVAALAGNPDMASLITRVGPTATTWSAMLAAGIGQQGAQNDFSITNSDVVSGCSVDRDPISEHPSS